MENYFQAEAFNLDKVLDEFEQNEDETDTPTLSDAKWTQILAPPAHLLSLNPALTHADLSPRDSPINFKPLLEPPSSGGSSLAEVTGPDVKQGPGLPPEVWNEDRPADVHSPPLLQPNIGKLVSADSQALESPSSTRAALENGFQSGPACNGLAVVPQASDDPPVSDLPSSLGSGPGAHGDQQNDPAKGDSACFNDSHFSFPEEGLGYQELGLKNGASPAEMETTGASKSDDGLSVAVKEAGRGECNLGLLEGSSSKTGNGTQELAADRECPMMGAFQNGNVVKTESEKKDSWDVHQQGKDMKDPEDSSVVESPGTERSQQNGVVEEHNGEPSTQPPAPSKEDSVTEEKEMEESKQESCEPRGSELTGGGGKLNNNRLQIVSVPYGGARPKQPVGLKLQIPQPLSGQVQNELASTGRNKNLEAHGRAGSLDSSSGSTDSGTGRMNGESVEGSSGSDIPSENPDNDLQAGQQGALSRKPFSSLGDVAPVWVPDSQAPICMKCEVKFTFTKRRHHCRACGKVFCAACCSLKCRLMYMDRKEARVCVTCHHALMNGSLPREQRRVWFADGILPNGETAESTKAPASNPSQSQPLTVSQYSNKSTAASTQEAAHAPGAPVGSPVGSSVSLIPEDGLPPILISTGVKGGTGGHISDYAVEERPSEILLLQQLEEGGPDPLVFVLNANLLAMVKLVNYVNRKCWYVTTKGMHAVGQAEVVVLLQCLPDEKSIPKDIFSHFVQLYQEALTGNVLSHLGHSFFTQSFLGSKEHGGFLYISPTFQSLQDLPLPNPPYLFGVLVQKWETPWAKIFPIRLMLRLGAEYRFYPCPLFSVRFRKPLFGETGHTIINLLADFRNYQYTLPVVRGLVVDMEVRKTCIKIPSNRYNELMKAMNKSNEHVLAMGACFNERADSHLVCVQNDDGNYQTQAISIHHQPRKVTGACFFVFSGALKTSSGYLAKTSIVEDGVMVQITAETMEALRQALREMKDFSIVCGKADQEENQEHVNIQWIEDDLNFNKGVISPIDGKSMESITSVKIFHGSEYKANGKVIRWTEVFFLQSDDQPSGLSDPADHSRLTENVARAFCMALCPHLKLLKEDGMAKLGLRVTLDSDQVGYLAGSNGQPLLPQYLSDLDSALIPVIHSGACQLSEGPVVMELIFYILEIIS
ncbi:zinc finger FYVE domain-containing protein 9 isoform X3 [Salminus brasiliensis]|uniref:zinc finger FYVE domain-containing protein 9 isoform X3 n=1 Tax=Salminus brasiliensis TaxID=930266 RepID=UPI003B836CB9